jgi:dimethylamine/trimethylamine dehydrogenase
MVEVPASAPVPTQAYLETLLLYYEEEVEGEAYFEALADLTEKSDHRDKLHLLARVEHHAASVTLPLIRKYALTPRSDAILFQSGQDQARATEKPWDDLLADMARTFPRYVDDFMRLEAMAPCEDLPHLKLLTAHEIAAIEFLDLEMSGARDSVAPMNAYLEKDIT